MTNKPGDIKDVIHFYLGAECEVEGLPGIWNLCYCRTDSWYGVQDNISGIQYVRLDKIKLILRPLSSMTEEEMIELTNQYNIDFAKGIIENSIERSAWGTKRFIWLLKNSFDIFQLIESNQAIDKTKAK